MLKGSEGLELKLTLPVPTSINALYINQFMYDQKARRRIPTGGRILSKEGELCKQQIQFHAEKQLSEQIWDYEWTAGKNNFLHMDANIYFARRGRDSDNVYKLLHDSLEKIVFENDSRVLARTQKVLYDTVNPRIELTLTPVEYVGVFEDQEKADTFEANCKGCTRYLEGRCSILVDSLAATVREEIETDDQVCTKYKEKK